MKVIDLLNKIANGEQVPKILHNGKYGIYEKEKRAVAFYNDEKCTSYFGSWFKWELCEDGLNDEIEIIEEPKKIEKVMELILGETEFNKYAFDNKQIRRDLDVIAEKLNETIRKQQEIIDYITSKEDK